MQAAAAAAAPQHSGWAAHMMHQCCVTLMNVHDGFKSGRRVHSGQEPGVGRQLQALQQRQQRGRERMLPRSSDACAAAAALQSWLPAAVLLLPLGLALFLLRLAGPLAALSCRRRMW